MTDRYISVNGVMRIQPLMDADEVTDAISDMAEENGWGFTGVFRELSQEELDGQVSPLTLEMVDDVILQALDDWHSCLGWDEMERYAFAGHVKSRLRQQMGGGGR